MTRAAQPGTAPLPYVGRFAPSPTGPLHFGSMVAALASFLDARANGGRWLVRVEDIDPPREVAGASDAILATLEHWGLHWDGAVLFQSTRLAVYRGVVERLLQQGLAFRCRCTRRTLGSHAQVYPGHCRDAELEPATPHSIRIRAGQGKIGFTDLLQGRLEWDRATDLGDFVIWRRDGLCSYQLAVTIDDDFQGITHIVRGMDLMDSTARQIHLRQLLGMREPAFAHFALAVDASMQKLSKQSGARSVDDMTPGSGLWRALTFLQQRPPVELDGAPVQEQLEWAVENWQPVRLRGLSAIEIDSVYEVSATHPDYVAPQQA